MKELIEALHVIQDECNRSECCKTCRMCTQIENRIICNVVEKLPEAWKINDEAQKALL